MIAVVQFLVEVVGSVFVSLPIDVLPRRWQPPHTNRAALTMILAIVGGMCGWASVALFPYLMLQTPALRMLSLVASPVLAGCLGLAIAKRRSHGDPFIEPSHQFWYAFAFTLSFTLYRFAYGRHEGA